MGVEVEMVAVAARHLHQPLDRRLVFRRQFDADGARRRAALAAAAHLGHERPQLLHDGRVLHHLLDLRVL